LVVFSVGSALLKHGESWGSSWKTCCYGSKASQAGRSMRKVPLSYVEDFSFKWGLWNGAGTAGAQGWQEHGRIGDSILHCLPKLSCPTVRSVHRPLCPLGLNITEQNKMPWISLWYTGCLDFRGFPWNPISQCGTSRLGRVEWGYMEAQSPVDLTSLVLWPAGYIKPWPWMFEEITLSHLCFLVFIKYWCFWKVLYLDESPETHLYQNT
jgi:hypothetical protein